jgi:hypothetical protein
VELPPASVPPPDAEILATPELTDATDQWTLPPVAVSLMLHLPVAGAAIRWHPLSFTIRCPPPPPPDGGLRSFFAFGGALSVALLGDALAPGELEAPGCPDPEADGDALGDVEGDPNRVSGVSAASPLGGACGVPPSDV